MLEFQGLRKGVLSVYNPLSVNWGHNKIMDILLEEMQCTK